MTDPVFRVYARFEKQKSLETCLSATSIDRRCGTTTRAKDFCRRYPENVKPNPSLGLRNPRLGDEAKRVRARAKNGRKRRESSTGMTNKWRAIVVLASKYLLDFDLGTPCRMPSACLLARAAWSRFRNFSGAARLDETRNHFSLCRSVIGYRS